MKRSIFDLVFFSVMFFVADASLVFAQNDPNTVCQSKYLSYWQSIYGSDLQVDAVLISGTYPSVCFRCWGYKPNQGVATGDECIDLKKTDPEPDCSSGSVGDPIRLSDGAVYEKVVDISAPPGSTLEWSRKYSSTSRQWDFAYPVKNDFKYEGAYFSNKYGWNISYFNLPDGSSGAIYKNSSGGYKAVISDNYLLASSDDSSFRLTTKNNDHNITVTPDTGKLASISNFSGAVKTLAYSGSYANSICDEKGNCLRFYFYDENLRFVEASWGAVVHYLYDGAGRLSRVGYGKNMASAPQGFFYTEYVYEDTRFPFAITGVIDPKGVRYATWKYDDKGRAIENYLADGVNRVKVIYPSFGGAIVVNPLGKMTVYEYVSITGQGLKVKKVQGESSPNCPLDDVYQSYYATGYLQTRTDKNGVVTLFERDTLGRVVKESKGWRWPGSPRYGGQVTTSDLVPPTNTSELHQVQTCWHSAYPIPLRIIEGNKITNFEYDEKWNLIKKTILPKPAGNVDCNTVF